MRRREGGDAFLEIDDYESCSGIERCGGHGVVPFRCGVVRAYWMPTKEDRRQYVLELSPAGKRVARRVEEARLQIARRMVAALDDRDLADFERIARKLRTAFEGG